MDKQIDYNVVQSPSYNDLVAAVKLNLRSGFQCIGGVAIDKNGWFLQAMVKHETPPVVMYERQYPPVA